MRTFMTALTLACASALSHAQAPTDFLADAVALSSQELRTRFDGSVLTAKLADGSRWRLQFNANGYLFLNTSGGYSDSGTWTVEDNRWCTDMRKTGTACSEVRRSGDVVHFKRTRTGEVVPMTAD